MRLIHLFLPALLALGCQGKVGISSDGSPAGPGSSDPPSANNATVPDDPFPELPCEGVACEPAVPSVTPRAARLTHHQWENSVRDLLRLPDRPGLSSAFLADPLSTSRFDRFVETMEVTPGLWDDYREAAETLAAQVANDPAALNALVPAGAPSDLEGRTRALVEDFGQRAYRRPLTAAEVDSVVALAGQAPELFGEATFARAAELVLRVFLQSPHFLYRIETHDVPDAAIVPLSGYERASRLSYALWNTMPDDELLAAAGRGDLDDPDLLTQQVQRMLDDPKAADVIEDFHGQLLDFGHFKDITKAPEVFADFTPETPAKMQRELELFVDDVVRGSQGSFRDLMTAQHSFVDRELAAIYGVDPPAGEFGRVELGDRRPGMLTRVGFLALNGTAYDPNPIHRGVFVDRHILCMQLPLPPDNFSIPDGVEGNTNRERIENATSSCGGGCHTPLINPPGYAFENYDAVGAWRDEDNGYPVDAAGALYFDREEKSWQTGAEFVGLLAESRDAHACYTRNWFEYLNGRAPGDGDEPLLARLAQASHDGDVSVKELILATVTSNVFLQRATGRDQ